MSKSTKHSANTDQRVQFVKILNFLIGKSGQTLGNLSAIDFLKNG